MGMQQMLLGAGAAVAAEGDAFFYKNAQNESDIQSIDGYTGYNTWTDASTNGSVEVSWTVPAGVTSISIICIGSGYGRHSSGSYHQLGGAGALAYRSNIPVTPGETLYVFAGHKREGIMANGNTFMNGLTSGGGTQGTGGWEFSQNSWVRRAPPAGETVIDNYLLWARGGHKGTGGNAVMQHPASEGSHSRGGCGGDGGTTVLTGWDWLSILFSWGGGGGAGGYHTNVCFYGDHTGTGGDGGDLDVVSAASDATVPTDHQGNAGGGAGASGGAHCVLRLPCYAHSGHGGSTYVFGKGDTGAATGSHTTGSNATSTTALDGKDGSYTGTGSSATLPSSWGKGGGGSPYQRDVEFAGIVRIVWPGDDRQFPNTNVGYPGT
jgi:hypothetical protein